MAIQNMEAFQVRPYAVGLDLNRSQIKESLGNYIVDSSATIRSGMLVQQGTDQEIEVCNGVTPYGFAKFNQATTLYGAVVGEYVQLNGLVATQLAHTNLFNPTAAFLTTRVGLALTGAVYDEVAGADYTIDHVNGTIVRGGASAIADGAWVYVNYLFALSATELNQYGRNFWNSTDDTAFQAARGTVITDWSLIFTANYDPSATYTVGETLYAGLNTRNKQGLVVDNNTDGTTYIGRCFQVPTPTDPFLGVKYIGGLIA